MLVIHAVLVATVTYIINEVATALFPSPLVPGITLGDVFASVVTLIVLIVVTQAIAKGH